MVVNLPDINGRTEILKVHLKKVEYSKDLPIRDIARGTPGFSGADLANLVNEAALMAARANKRKINIDIIEGAKDKILMGTERRSMVMTEEQKKLTAYHESGHAIVGYSMPGHDPVYKVTIIPRGQALGVTTFLPEEDQVSASYKDIIARICSLYGGRIAEEIIFGKEAITTGASSDIKRATELARSMVTTWGLSEEMGPIRYQDEDDGNPFLGRTYSSGATSRSDKTTRQIDREISRIVKECYDKATEILTGKKQLLHSMAKALLEHETLDETQIKAIMEGKPAVPKAKPKAKAAAKKAAAGSKKPPKSEEKAQPGKARPTGSGKIDPAPVTKDKAGLKDPRQGIKP